MSEELQRRLFALQDEAYRRFQCALMPTVPRQAVIGVRTPALRALGRELAGTPLAEKFLAELPHQYYEENNLHGILLSRLPDFPRTIAALEEFLPYVDNWATCDMLSPPVLAKHLPELLEAVRRWLVSEHPYTVRFAMGMLQRYYLSETAFRPEYPAMVAAVESEEYYVNMMAAWYFATALAKQPKEILPYFTERRLKPWTWSKAVQKALESRRIAPEQKALLRSLREGE